MHSLVLVPPHISVSKTIQYIKGYTSRKLLMEYKEVSKQFLEHHFWARGYFAASSRNVTDKIIIEYIGSQEVEELQKSDNFTTEPILSPLSSRCFQQIVIELNIQLLFKIFIELEELLTIYISLVLVLTEFY